MMISILAVNALVFEFIIIIMFANYYYLTCLYLNFNYLSFVYYYLNCCLSPIIYYLILILYPLVNSDYYGSVTIHLVVILLYPNSC